MVISRKTFTRGRGSAILDWICYPGAKKIRKSCLEKNMKPHFLDTLLRSSNPIDENFETKIGCTTMSWVNKRNKIISKGTCDGEK